MCPDGLAPDRVQVVMLRYEPLRTDLWLPTEKGVEAWTYETQGATYEWRLWFAKAFRVLSLMLCDLFSVSGAYALGYILWAGPELHLNYLTYSNVGLLFPVFLLAYSIAGMYPGFGLGAVETVRRLSYTTSGVFLLFTDYRLYFKNAGADVPNVIRDRLDRSDSFGPAHALCNVVVRAWVALVGRGDSGRRNTQAN